MPERNYIYCGSISDGPRMTQTYKGANFEISHVSNSFSKICSRSLSGTLSNLFRFLRLIYFSVNSAILLFFYKNKIFYG